MNRHQNRHQRTISSKIQPSPPREYYQRNLLAIETQLMFSQRLKSIQSRLILPQLQQQYNIYVPCMNSQKPVNNTFYDQPEENNQENVIDKPLLFVKQESVIYQLNDSQNTNSQKFHRLQSQSIDKLTQSIDKFTQIQDTLERVTLNHNGLIKQKEILKYQQQENFRKKFLQKFLINKMTNGSHILKDIDPANKILRVLHIDNDYEVNKVQDLVIESQTTRNRYQNKQKIELRSLKKISSYSNDKFPSLVQKNLVSGPQFRSFQHIMNQQKLQGLDSPRKLYFLQQE